MKALSFVWRDAGRGSGFLTLEPARGGGSGGRLILYVAVARAGGGGTVAWWETPAGTFLGFADVGEA
jgi:hypothetical protein